MKNPYFFTFTFSLLLGVALASPTVTSFSQNPETLEVTVSYTLDAPAIVTVDFQKKDGDTFKSIGEENFTKLSGDVNRYIETTGAHMLLWTVNEEAHGTGSGGPLVSAENFKVVLKAWPLLDPPNYMAVNLSVSNSVFYYVSSNAVPYGVTDKLYKDEFLLMRRIPAKDVTWKMGSPDSDLLRDATRETRHEVTLTADYWMGVYEFTQAQVGHLGSSYGSHFTAFDESYYLPVSGAAYYVIRGDLGAANWPSTGHTVGGYLKTLRKRTGVEFDLPTEAQWEYACRAGTGTQYCWPHLSFETTDAANRGLAKYAIMVWNNFPCSSTLASPGPVGMYLPNAWGLYDMHGNAREWCLDYLQVDLGSAPVENPIGPTSATNNSRVWRGGGFTTNGAECRSAYRGSSSDELAGANGYFGFRVMAPIGLKW